MKLNFKYIIDRMHAKDIRKTRALLHHERNEALKSTGTFQDADVKTRFKEVRVGANRMRQYIPVSPGNSDYDSAVFAFPAHHDG